jgi:hypothetical protein
MTHSVLILLKHFSSNVNSELFLKSNIDPKRYHIYCMKWDTQKKYMQTASPRRESHSSIYAHLPASTAEDVHNVPT